MSLLPPVRFQRFPYQIQTPQAVSQGIVGNPFDWQKYGAGEAVSLFVDWIINNDDHGEPLATEEFRNAIINLIMSTAEPNILYYKELGHHSHATALGFIIENKKFLFSAKEEMPVEQKKIDIWSTNHDKYANLSNVAIRSIDITPSIVSVVNEHFPQKESAKALDKLDNVTESRMINRILRLAPEGFDKFNSVEQLF